MAVHPTTGAWFGLWIAVALVVNARERRAATAALAALALAVAAAAAGALALRGSLVVMDAAWLDAIGSKRYLFPNTWKPGTWAVNAIAPAIVAGVYVWRRRTGRTLVTEAGVVAGCLALVAAFLASLPFVAEHVAIAVQLQTSRVFWHVELLATIYLVWLVVDVRRGPGVHGCRTRRTGAGRGARRGRRGARLLHPARAVRSSARPRRAARRRLAGDGDRGRRTETPVGTRFLVDPQHVGRYGVSFRVAAARDVFLETVKDSAMATYSRDVALGVVERQKALPSFDDLTAPQALALASRYGLQVMITERRPAAPPAPPAGPVRRLRSPRPMPRTPDRSFGRRGLALLAAAVAAWMVPVDGSGPPAAMFRGDPAHTGVYAGAGPRALHWVRWTFEAGGAIRSSPAVAGGRVYVGSDDGKVYGLEAATGTVAWTFDAESPIGSSPAVADGLVFVTTRSNAILALDAGSGALRWRRETGPDLPWAWGYEGWDYYTSSPVVVDGLVVAGSGDGSILAADAATGTPRWVFRTERARPLVTGCPRRRRLLRQRRREPLCD